VALLNSHDRQVAGSKVNGTIPMGGIPAGNGNYICNARNQQACNFNIDGNGIN